MSTIGKKKNFWLLFVGTFCSFCSPSLKNIVNCGLMLVSPWVAQRKACIWSDRLESRELVGLQPIVSHERRLRLRKREREIQLKQPLNPMNLMWENHRRSKLLTAFWIFSCENLNFKSQIKENPIELSIYSFSGRILNWCCRIRWINARYSRFWKLKREGTNECSAASSSRMKKRDRSFEKSLVRHLFFSLFPLFSQLFAVRPVLLRNRVTIKASTSRIDILDSAIKRLPFVLTWDRINDFPKDLH